MADVTVSFSDTVLAKTIPSEWERAVAYGDGLFETVAVFNGGAPLWSHHRVRMAYSLTRLCIKMDMAMVERHFFALAEQMGNALIKITIARSGGKRGYDARFSTSSILSFQCHPQPQYPLSNLAGVALFVCSHRLSRNVALTGIKHLNRLEQVLAASEWNRTWAQEGLLLDDSGAVVDGTISNVFIVSNGVLLTPRLDHCGVAGVMRAFILQVIAPALNISVQERRLTLADLLASDECFICNSVFGVWPVLRIGVSFIGDDCPGIHTVAIMKKVRSLGYKRLYA